MAWLEPVTLVEPVSDEDVCGPDLQFANDPEFQNFFASSADLLPPSFFRANEDDSKSEAYLLKLEDPNVAAATAAIESLSRRTRDLRLAVWQAKLFVLSRDAESFAAMLAGIADALEKRWDAIHPQAEDEDDFFMRTQTVEALDETPHVIMPLQHAFLIETSRGGLSYRSWLLANGKLNPRSGEEVPVLSAMERAFNDFDLDALVARRAVYSGIVDTARRIEACPEEKKGQSRHIKLPKLKALASEIAAFLDEMVAKRAPSRVANPAQPAALAPTGLGALVSAIKSSVTAAPASAVTGIKDRADAKRSLRGACAYFERFEPSSPAVLMLRFAEGLMGKPFYEVMRVMMPDHAGRAAVQVGQNAFRLAIGHLAENVESGPEPEPAKPEKGPALDLKTRADALAQLDAVATFLRATEPASPIPLLLVRVRDLAERDFTSLVKDLFTDSQLRSMSDSD